MDLNWFPLAFGVVAGVAAIVIGGRGVAAKDASPASPGVLGWIVLGFGLLTAALAVLLTSSGSGMVDWVWGCGLATLIAGVGAIVRRDRKWATWVGLVVGVAAALFWAIFALGYALGGPSEDEFLTSAAQIAEEAGFTAIFPPDERPRLGEGAAPVETAGGVFITYDRFEMLQRKGTGATEADLERLVEGGTMPMGDMGMTVESGGKITRTKVQGRPAVANEYTYTFPFGDPNGEERTAVMLVFEVDGVDVRMVSGGPAVSGALSVDELVAIADTMKPLD